MKAIFFLVSAILLFGCSGGDPWYSGKWKVDLEEYGEILEGQTSEQQHPGWAEVLTTLEVVMIEGMAGGLNVEITDSQVVTFMGRQGEAKEYEVIKDTGDRVLFKLEDGKVLELLRKDGYLIMRGGLGFGDLPMKRVEEDNTPDSPN